MLVSVIIPCFNCTNYIERCLDSIFQLNYKLIEVICVENCSTDDTLIKLNLLKQKYNFTIYNENREGACFARNKGLEMANGDWIQFVDADDVVYHDKLTRQLSLVTSTTKLIVGAYDMLINNEIVKYPIENLSVWSLLIKSGLGNTVSNLWHTATLRKIGAWNEALTSSQEFELMFRMIQEIQTNEIVYDKISSMLYYMDIEGSISKNFTQNTVVRIDLRKKVLDFILINKLEGSLLNEVKDYMFDDLRYLCRLNYKLGCEKFDALKLLSFKPKHSFNNSYVYLTLYHLLGFKKVEWFYKLFRGIHA